MHAEDGEVRPAVVPAQLRADLRSVPRLTAAASPFARPVASFDHSAASSGPLASPPPAVAADAVR